MADALDAGDVCTAAGLADELNKQVITAINEGRIPQRFQEDVQARANELVNAVNCPEPVAEADDGGEDEPKKDKEKEKKDDEDDGGGEAEPPPPPTQPPPPPTDPGPPGEDDD